MNPIDIHIHPDPAGRPHLSGAGMAEAMVGLMDHAGLAMCGILGEVHPGQDAASVRRGNDYTQATVSARPERLFGLCFVNPGLEANAVRDELDQRLSHPAFRGIKLELDVNCRDARLDVVMERAIYYSVPVLHHSWYINLWGLGPAAREKQAGRSESHDIAALARRFPQARIIMAHMEGSGIRGLLDIAECPNVWVDTSGSLPFSGTLEMALELIGPERIVYGSDLYGRGLEGQLGRILGTPMPPQAREAILIHNARSLFALPEVPAFPAALLL